MDFIDPIHRRRHHIRLTIGYVLIGCAIIMATLTLLYQSFGYSLGKDGELIQKGLVFMSSTPHPAQVYLNGKARDYQTNARLNLPAGQYTVRLERTGYRPWQRPIGVEGGSLQHFDYPFLFPQRLQTSTVERYTTSPNILQTPNRRWLLVQQPGSLGSFDQYDTSNPDQLTKTTIAFPANVLTGASSGGELTLESWSNDNRHALLRHTYSGGAEYVMLDRQNPAESINLTKVLTLAPTTKLSLRDNKHDRYLLHDTASGVLSTASLNALTPMPLLDHVVAFKSYGSSTILYATTKDAAADKVIVRLLQDGKTYTLQQLASGATTYLLDLARYEGAWLVVVGDSTSDKTYVYKNPQAGLAELNQPLVPAHILKVSKPTHVAFSKNAQFILAERGPDIAVYDIENDKGYTYQLAQPFAPDQHATWMDGHRLTATLNGKVVVWDYDNANPHMLQGGLSGVEPLFDQEYGWSYVVAPDSSTPNMFLITKTALRTPVDQ